MCKQFWQIATCYTFLKSLDPANSNLQKHLGSITRRKGSQIDPPPRLDRVNNEKDIAVVLSVKELTLCYKLKFSNP